MEARSCRAKTCFRTACLLAVKNVLISRSSVSFHSSALRRLTYRQSAKAISVAVVVAIASLVGACGHGDRSPAAENAACKTSAVQPPADVGEWAGAAPVVGSAPLWAVIPQPDWIDVYERGGVVEYRLKLGWFRQESGRLRMRVEPIDGKGVGSADVPKAGYGDVGFIPTLVSFSGPGCWRIAGQMDGTEVSIYVAVR